ncbi:SAM-dependent methyltransferase [Desulfobacterales bacterium HSG17]|nr:SAM-dependent methyltransferase [Desulfobacterales bacterium HSG17]
MLLDLRSVIYDVDDLQKAKEWYAKVLNTKPEVDQSSFVSFKIGEDWLGLNLVDDSSHKDDSRSVAYWTVPNVNEEHERLLGLGALAKGGIQNIGQGFYLAKVKDPFGNIIGICTASITPDNTAIEEKPSKTALWTTFMRAFSTKEKNIKIQGQDNIASIFLPEDQINELQDMSAPEIMKEKYFVPGIYEYVIARTKIFDHFFNEALDEKVEQIVFLGAGYDSRSYRFGERLDATKVFELDIPVIQKHKRECLSNANIEIPAQVSFVPINFNTESIADALLSTDFDKDKKTFFVWEGVTPYLSAEAVDATLAFVSANSRSDSTIAFDYTALWPGIMEAYGVKELIDFNSKNQSGESIVSFALNEDLISTFLMERGFKISEYMNPDQIEKSCLMLDDKTLFGHVTGSTRIVKALTI